MAVIDTSAATEEEVMRIVEGFGRMVDQYVLTVTDRICGLDAECGDAMLLPAIAERRGRILAHLDTLERMMSDYREKTGQ